MSDLLPGSRYFSRTVIWLLVCAALSMGPLVAQESLQGDLGGQSLEDLVKVRVSSVNGASEFLQKAQNAATSLTVVTADEIQKHGYRTLADVLRSVRGFYVINDRNYSYVGVRGFSKPGDYNARILFLLDGHRVNDNIFDGAYVGTGFPLDVDLIERIEIIRGPNSSLYGTGAFVAVINVITKRGRDLDALEFAADAGSGDTYKGRVSYGNRFDNGLETLFSATFVNSKGHSRLFFPEFDSPATNNGIAENADGDRSYDIFADIIHRDFNIHILSASRTKHIPTASFGTVFNDSRNRSTDARSYVDVQYHHTFGLWEMLGRASYDWYDYHGIYVFDYSDGAAPVTENYDAANGSWLDFQGDVSRTFFSRHKVTLGSEYRQDIRQQQVNYDIDPYNLYLDDHRSSRILAFYSQDEYSVRRNFTVVAGVRADLHARFENTVSPRIGLRFTPITNTDLKATYSWAFRAPNSYESFYAGNNSNSTNLSLKPERIRSGEVNLEHRFGKTYYASAAGFLNRIDDRLDQGIEPGTDLLSYTNAEPIQTKGIDFELGAKRADGIAGSVSYTLQDSLYRGDRQPLTNSPKHLAKMSLSAPLVQRRLFASVDAQYVSEVRTVAQTELGGFVLLNLSLFTGKIGERFDVSGSVYNIFNKRYAASGGLEHVQASIAQDGRSFRINVKARPRFGAN